MKIAKWDSLAVWAGVALFAAAFSLLACLRFDAFELARYDLGNMTQAVWSTAHGSFLGMTDGAGNQISRLGVHFDPILTLFTPLYLVWPDPRVLLAGQATVVALGALPVFWLARSELKGLTARWVPVLFAFIYLAYVPLQYAVLDEFHPLTLAAPLLLFAIWALREGRNLWLVLSVVLLLLCRESTGLVVAMLGLYGLLVWKQRRSGLAIFLGGLAAFGAVTQWVTPHFNNGVGSDLLARYYRFGGDIGGVATSLFTKPGLFFSALFSGSNIGYLAKLLWPLLFLPLLAPVALIVAAPELGINLLSSQSAQQSIHFHYVAIIAPVFIWAALLGYRRLICKRPALANTAAVLLGLSVLVSSWLYGPLPFWSKVPLGSDFKAGTYTADSHDRVIRRALELVPPAAVVSATNQIGSHLSERRRILVFPHVAGAEYVVVDRRNPAFGDARGSAADQAAAVAALRSDPRFRLVFSCDGVLLFKADRMASTSQTASKMLRKTRGQTKAPVSC